MTRITSRLNAALADSVIMSKKRKSIYVSHPLYGDTPNYTNDRFQLGDVLNSHWSYKEESVVLGTVIEANIDKQNYSIYPRKLYVDLKKQCVQCNRWFLFYAEEQRYWFETLGFYIDADCTKCIDCRKKEQSIKVMRHEYEVLKKNDERTVEETRKLKNIAFELYQLGYIKNKSKIDEIS